MDNNFERDFDLELKMIEYFKKKLDYDKQQFEDSKKEAEHKKPRGRPKKVQTVIQKKKSNYLVTYNGETKEFKSMKDVSAYTGKSQTCLFRILDNKNVYKKKTSHELKNIEIKRID